MLPAGVAFVILPLRSEQLEGLPNYRRTAAFLRGLKTPFYITSRYEMGDFVVLQLQNFLTYF